MPITVLLIENDIDNLADCRAALERHGFEVLHASDGVSGRRIACEREPTFICLDLTNPERDGLQIVRLLQADPATSPVPVIALTLGEEPADRVRARDAGCHGYLPKRVVSEIGELSA